MKERQEAIHSIERSVLSNKKYDIGSKVDLNVSRTRAILLDKEETKSLALPKKNAKARGYLIL